MPLLERLPFRLRVPSSGLAWLAAMAIVAGAAVSVLGRPGPVPGAGELVRVEGRVRAVDVYDLSGSPTQADWFPGLTTVRVELEGELGSFVYPAGYPLYFLVRDSLGGPVVLWVEATAPIDEPRTIWQLEVPNAGLFVGHGDIAATLDSIDRSARGMGGGLLLAGMGLGVAAWLGGLINRRLPEPSEETRERWRHRRDGFVSIVLDGVGGLERLYDGGARLCAALLGPMLGRGLWSAVWACLYFGGAIALGVAVYGG
ncbi:MAG: hypothetical protein WD673_13785 [Alphaproteobacteria bacterium]